MPKGPLKTPFKDYIVPGKGPGSSVGVYELSGDGSDLPQVIGIRGMGAPADLLEKMGK